MNLYEFGKNYLISCKKIDLNILFENNNMIDFLRGYIELNSELIKPDIFNFEANDEVIFNIYFVNEDIDIANYIKNTYNIECNIIQKR